MRIIRLWIKKAFTSVTIMVIPHDRFKTLDLRLPIAGLIAAILLAAVGGVYLLSLAVNAFQLRAQQRAMAEKVQFYSEQFQQWNSTATSLKTVDRKFRKLFSLNSREEVLQYADASVGSLGIPDLSLNLKKTIASVTEMREYLRIQTDIYAATPLGYPVPGTLTSDYGIREDPLSGDSAFHPGIDISCKSGVPIRATAAGIVRHSGWTESTGFALVLEHGFGFSTVYAHNRENIVKVGAKVKRGDIIGYVGSTGRSTGPHVHYEIWKDGLTIDPRQFLFRRT